MSSADEYSDDDVGYYDEDDDEMDIDDDGQYGAAAARPGMLIKLPQNLPLRWSSTLWATSTKALRGERSTKSTTRASRKLRLRSRCRGMLTTLQVYLGSP